MGTFLSANAFTPGTSGAVSVVTLPSGLLAGDRVYVLVSNGGANPNTITDPVTATWTKADEWSPDGTFKSALYYIDVTAGNASALSSSSHTWTWSVSGRAAASWAIYRDVDQSRAPQFAKISGTNDSAAATNVPALTVPSTDWAGFAVGARQSPGTDGAKTWAISGYTSDAERIDQYATNAGTGQKLSIAMYDTAGLASASTPSGGGGGAQTITVTDAPPVNTYNSIALNATARIGATLDKTALDVWKPRLKKNGWVRIFPDSDKLPPDWEDLRIGYCRDVAAFPFLSSKCDGDVVKIQALYDHFAAMPTWILNDPVALVYFVEHHEPEKEYADKYGSNAAGASHYIADYKAVWNKLATLPGPIRAKIRMGPALTKQWTEVSSKGNFDYQPFDPGTAFRQFKGYDAYVDSGSLNQTSSVYPNPAAWLQYIKADNAGGQQKILVEFGAINKIGDDSGTGRAAWIQGCYDELKTWTDFGGFLWWNDHGTPSATSITNIGKARFFELDLRYASADTPTDITKVTTTITYGGGGGGGTARAVTPNVQQSHAHVWSYTVPMLGAAPPAEANAWSTMGMPRS